ncbi:MAG: hypothetical protein QOH81_2491 [Sphingomonadales bacterium]|jgi:hypothetical protein|nr:hypothetical protein [Sphingomonadales bacterium]
MADEPKEGWAPWEPPEDRGDSGVGAFRGHKHPPGPGDHGVGEARKRDPDVIVPPGPPQPEFPPLGWGGKEGDYPPTRGPVAEPDDKGEG